MSRLENTTALPVTSLHEEEEGGYWGGTEGIFHLLIHHHFHNCSSTLKLNCDKKTLKLSEVY